MNKQHRASSVSSLHSAVICDLSKNVIGGSGDSLPFYYFSNFEQDNEKKK